MSLSYVWDEPGVRDYMTRVDRVTLVNRLESAKRRVGACDTLVAHQKSVIESLRSAGNDTNLAEETLRTLEIVQQEYLAEVEELLDQLDRVTIVG
jgi:hypothetical protein